MGSFPETQSTAVDVVPFAESKDALSAAQRP